MTRNRRNKVKFIKELEEHPIIERACRKLGTSRATFYRWKQEDPEFKAIVEAAQDIGRTKINDFAESKLIENISANQHAAIVFWLRHNMRRYRPHEIRLYIDENKRLTSNNKQWVSSFDWLIGQIGNDNMLKILRKDPKTFWAEIEKEIEKQRKELDEI